jgi:aspartyl-tRNA(Asn)/glutamyl-tRNA(Gln) amidotransferase subunit A
VTNTNQDICYVSATGLAAAIRAKTLSPVELVQAVFKRLHKTNDRVNAFCTLTEEEALRAARKAETAAMKRAPLGVLHGLPVSIKDVLLTNGVRTMFGSCIQRNYVPDEDAPAVAKMLAAGGISIGKTTTPEFGFKAVTDSPVTGITRNPWDLSKTAGGSSGGAGAAVAIGAGPLALGTDGAGSIRIPASFNGIFGFKPSYGRVAAYPPNPVPFLSHVGPMTRTVRDAALLLNAIAGPDERDVQSLPQDQTDYLAGCEGGIRGLRIAWSPTLGYAKVDCEVANITDAAAKSFGQTLGCNVELADPGFESPHSFFATLWTMSYALRFEALLPEWKSRMDPDLVRMIARASHLGPSDYGEALAKRLSLWRKTQAFFNRFELLLTPTLPVTAFPAGCGAPEGLSDTVGALPPFPEWLPFTYPWNLTGQPAATVPCGFTRNGLPVGLQIVGRRFADATVLRAAAAFEDAYPWTHKVPPLDQAAT